METEKAYKFAFSNTCMCADSDYNDDFVMFEALQIDCEGECWEAAMEDFKDITGGLFDDNETMWWKITGFPLWSHEVNGYAYAKTPEDLIRAMTVNSEWTIRGTVFNDKIEYSLSHHDRPTGSHSIVTMITDEQREELGLY
jgi:hypothetical protein